MKVGKQLIELAQWLDYTGLNRAASGNVSRRLNDTTMLITPTNTRADDLTEDDLALVALHDGAALKGKPSTEAAMHRLTYQSRPELKWMVHHHGVEEVLAAQTTHPYSTLPRHHYSYASLGSEVRVLLWERFSSDALAYQVAEYFRNTDGRACLLARHGAVIVSEGDRAHAADLTEELTFACRLANELGPQGQWEAHDEEWKELVQVYGVYKQRENCIHEWVDGDNEVVSNAKICVHCGTIRPKS